MQEALSSTFRALAVAASSQTDHQVTTTIRQIIKEHERTFGFRPSLKKTKRAVKGLMDDGLFRLGPPPLCRELISPFNRPFVLIATQKGLDHLAALEKEAAQGDDPDTEKGPPPDLDLSPPKYLPKLDPNTLHLPPKPHAIVMAIISVCKKFGKKGGWPSQKRILELCRKYHNVTMERSALNYWTAWLECYGWFRKIQRAPRIVDGKRKWQSTYYELCEKAWAWFKSLAAMVRRFAPVLSVQKIGHYLLKTKRVILGGSPSTGAKPPGSEHNSAPTASRSYEELTKLKPSDFKSLVASLAR